jgi:hypothetical protein
MRKIFSDGGKVDTHDCFSCAVRRGRSIRSPRVKEVCVNE